MSELWMMAIPATDRVSVNQAVNRFYANTYERPHIYGSKTSIRKLISSLDITEDEFDDSEDILIDGIRYIPAFQFMYGNVEVIIEYGILYLVN